MERHLDHINTTLDEIQPLLITLARHAANPHLSKRPVDFGMLTSPLGDGKSYVLIMTQKQSDGNFIIHVQQTKHDKGKAAPAIRLHNTPPSLVVQIRTLHNDPDLINYRLDKITKLLDGTAPTSNPLD